MTKEQFGTKKQEKEIKIECLQEKLGELFRQACPMMLLSQAILEIIVQ